MESKIDNQGFISQEELELEELMTDFFQKPPTEAEKLKFIEEYIKNQGKTPDSYSNKRINSNK